MQNSSEKCTQWCGNGPKFVHFGPKMTFFASNGPLCRPFPHHWVHFLANFASRVVPPHMFHCDPPFVPLLPSTWGPFWSLIAKKAFLAQNWPFLGHFHTIGCMFLTSFASRVVPPHVFHCDPPFVPLLPAMGVSGATYGQNGVFGPKLAIFGPFPCH